MLALSLGTVPTIHPPKVQVRAASGGDLEAARAYLAAALPAGERSFDVTLESDVEVTRHIAAVTMHARAVISDHRGVRTIVSTSARARGKARAYAIPQLRDRATFDVLDALALALT